MADYYKKNGIKMGPIQGNGRGNLLQEEPVFERSEDAAPDATFSDKGNNRNASKNILQLFSYIIEDLHDELSNEKKNEEKAQADYEKERDTAEKLKSDLEEKIVTLEGIIAKREEARKRRKRSWVRTTMTAMKSSSI